jgi:hypothetical protein
VKIKPCCMISAVSFFVGTIMAIIIAETLALAVIY